MGNYASLVYICYFANPPASTTGDVHSSGEKAILIDPL